MANKNTKLITTMIQPATESRPEIIYVVHPNNIKTVNSLQPSVVIEKDEALEQVLNNANITGEVVTAESVTAPSPPPLAEPKDEKVEEFRSWVRKHKVSNKHATSLITILNTHFNAKLPEDLYDPPAAAARAPSDGESSATTALIATLTKLITKIDQRTVSLEQNVKLIMNRLQDKSADPVALPIQSIDDYDIIKSQLEFNDKQTEKDLEGAFKLTEDSVAGRTKMLRNLFEDSVLVKFNCDGMKDKININNEKFFKLLFKCWRRNNFNHDQFIAFMKNEFRLAMFRLAKIGSSSNGPAAKKAKLTDDDDEFFEDD